MSTSTKPKSINPKSTNPKANVVFTTTFGLAMAVAGGLAYSPPTSAQDETANALLEEVVVTASRREENLQDIPFSVTVLDVASYLDAGQSNMSDMLSFVPGVSVNGPGGSFGNAVYIRGINAVLSAGVTSYVDEIPFGSSTVYTIPTPLDGTLLDLGTLDVLKGPQGTLYGSSALGGLLKFNTRDASLTDWTGSLSADLSDTSGGGFNQVYRVNANGPIATDTLGMSFTAFWSDRTGYIDNVNIPKDGWDDYEYSGASGSVRWAVNDQLEIKLQGLYQKSTQDGRPTIQANSGDDLLLPGLAAGEPWYGEYETGEALINPSEFEADMLGLTIDYDLGFGVLSSISSIQSLSFGQSTDLTVPFAFFADIFFPESAPHTSAIFFGDLGFDKFTQEVRLVSPSNENFEWIVGAYYTSEEGFNSQVLNVTPPVDLFFANFPSNYDELSLYGTGTYYFTPNFDGSFGFRYSDYSNDVELESLGPLVAPIPLTKIEDDVSNWMFNLRYRPNDNMAVYGRIASGYRPGGANFLLLDIEGNELTNPFYEPDSLWSYEIGLRGTSENGRFGYDVGAFYIDWEDYQINVIRAGLQVAGNADSAVSKGLEASLSFAATEALVFTGSFAYINAELTANEPDLGGQDGDQLPNSPEWQMSLDAQYNFSMGSLPSYVGASWRYKGDMPISFDGYAEGGVFYVPSAPNFTLDSYNLIDLRAGFTAGSFDFALYVTNLSDEWAYTSFASAFTAPGLGTPTRPRTYGGVIRWNF